MYCTNCGNKIEDGADVCLSCGVIVSKKKKDNNITGILSIIFGVISIILLVILMCEDISEVGMYTKVYERLLYAIWYVIVGFIFTVLSLVLSFIKKESKYSKIGFYLSMISMFLIITEIVVIIVY